MAAVDRYDDSAVIRIYGISKEMSYDSIEDGIRRVRALYKKGQRIQWIARRTSGKIEISMYNARDVTPRRVWRC